MKKYLLFFILIFSGFLSIQIFVNNINIFSKEKILTNINDKHYKKIVLEDLKGKRYKLRDFKNKLVLLNFWATWCSPCRDEIPRLIALKKKIKKIKIFGISLDDSKKDIFKFKKNLNINYPIIFKSNNKIANEFQVKELPVTYVFYNNHFKKLFVGDVDFLSEENLSFFKKLISK